MTPDLFIAATPPGGGTPINSDRWVPPLPPKSMSKITSGAFQIFGQKSGHQLSTKTKKAMQILSQYSANIRGDK